jgi:hypothetical protein
MKKRLRIQVTKNFVEIPFLVLISVRGRVDNVLNPFLFITLHVFTDSLLHSIAVPFSPSAWPLDACTSEVVLLSKRLAAIGLNAAALITSGIAAVTQTAFRQVLQGNRDGFMDSGR